MTPAARFGSGRKFEAHSVALLMYCGKMDKNYRLSFLSIVQKWMEKFSDKGF